VLPAQGAGFFGADPGEQAEHDVGVHQRGGPADIFEAGVQFHHGQGAGGGDHCGRLVEGEGSGGAALLAFGGVGEGGDVAADEVVGFGVPDGALEREVPHRDRGGGVSGGHCGECLSDVGGGQVAEFPGADDGQDGLEDVLTPVSRRQGGVLVLSGCLRLWPVSYGCLRGRWRLV
jgi:hypothetical protein